MKRVRTSRTLCLAVVLLPFGFLTFAEKSPWDIPGIRVVQTLDGVCPRDATVPLDRLGPCGEPLALSVGFQRPSVECMDYLDSHPMTQARRLAITLDNPNFSHAGVIDGVSGSLVWDFNAEGMIHRSALSPYGSRLFAASHDGNVYALDLDDGEVLWQRKPSGKLLEFAQSCGRLFVVTTEDKVQALDEDDGAKLWTYRIRTRMHSPYFTWLRVDDDSVYVSSADGSVLALDPFDGIPRWTYFAHGDEFSIKGLHAGTLILGRDDELIGLDTANGVPRWTVKTHHDACCAKLIHLDGDRFLTVHYSDPGYLRMDIVAFRASDGGELWRVSGRKLNWPRGNRMIAPDDVSPLGTAKTIAMRRDSLGTVDRLFVVGRKEITSIDMHDGSAVWTAPVKGAESLLYSGEALFAEGRGSVRAYDPSSGALLWDHAAGEKTSDMQRVGDTLLVETESGAVLAIATADGTLQRRLDTGFAARLIPAGEDRVIVCGAPASWVLAPDVDRDDFPRVERPEPSVDVWNPACALRVGRPRDL